VLLEPPVINRRRQSVLAIVAGLAAFSAGEGAKAPGESTTAQTPVSGG